LIHLLGKCGSHGLQNIISLDANYNQKENCLKKIFEDHPVFGFTTKLINEWVVPDSIMGEEKLINLARNSRLTTR